MATAANVLPAFYNSDGTLASLSLPGSITNNAILVSKIDAAGCWEFTTVVDGLSSEILPIIDTD